MGPMDIATRHSRRANRLATACSLALALSVAGCVPTLSQPHGEAFIAELDEAEAHQHAGRLQQAADTYHQAADDAERRVDRDEALYRESRVYARMKNYARAIEICDELGAAQPVARRTLRARLDAARYRIATGDRENGETALHTLMVEEAESAAARSALRILAERYVDGADSKDDAIAWLDSALEEAGETSIAEPLMGMKAEMLILKGDAEDAKTVLEEQVEKFPYPKGRRWDDGLYRLADLAIERGEPKEAIGYLERMVSVHEGSFIVGSYTRPLFSKSALRIARIYRDDLHDQKAAVKAFRAMRSEFPKSTHRDDSMYEEAALRIEMGDADDGCDLLRDLLEEFDSGNARRSGATLLEQRCK